MVSDICTSFECLNLTRLDTKASILPQRMQKNFGVSDNSPNLNHFASLVAISAKYYNSP
jgi:hypothetical protein